VLHPDQFEVNEAWIAFKLNEAPIHTESDGDFNVVALMDAASCFILSSAFVSTGKREQTKAEARRSLKEGQSHKQQLPQTLFVPTGYQAKNLIAEAESLGVAVVRVAEGQLLAFVGDAREGFKEHFGATGIQ
jgi:hypothetical protein